MKMNTLMPIQIILIFYFLLSSSLLGKELIIKGLVQDTSHNNLPGVTVKQEGAVESTVTDDRGEFSLKITQKENEKITLVLSKNKYLPLHFHVKKPEKRVEPHLTPVLDNNGISAGTVDVSMSHAINPVVTKWLEQNDRNKNDNKLDDGLYEELQKQPFFKKRPVEPVRYRLRLPANRKSVKGAFLISEHGMGQKMMEHEIFWNFADKNGFALIGLQGNPVQRGIYPASKLEEIIDIIAQKYKQPELSKVPYLTFGHSNGTGFSAFYPAICPERTICWISYHSGGTWHLKFQGVELTPGLVMHGTKDQFLKGQDKTVMELRTERNAPITMTMEYGMAHWPSDPEAAYNFIASYCQANIDTRIIEGRNELIPVAETRKKAWLGDVFDLSKDKFQKPEIAPAANYKGNKKEANYLPNENFAKKWQEYRATGK